MVFLNQASSRSSLKQVGILSSGLPSLSGESAMYSSCSFLSHAFSESRISWR